MASRRSRLRTQLVIYIVALHVALGALTVYVLGGDLEPLFAVEGFFVFSIVVAIVLLRALLAPLDLIDTGAELIAERDFTTKFVELGHPEMDTLIDVYNRMIDRLREERLASEETG